MKKLIIFVLGVVFLLSCGSGDKQAQLKKLEAQRDALDTQIAQLKAEIQDKNGSQKNEKIAYVNMEEVKPAMFRHFIRVQGTVDSDNNIFVPPQASGVVKKIYVKEGDAVSEGQLLAELDGSVYESNIAELENSLQLATTIFERQQRLWDKKIGSEIQYLQAKTNKEGLEKKLTTVREQYRMTKIITPISGRVDEVAIKEGEAAAARFGAVRIVQLSALKIKAKLSENYISQVSAGDTVQVLIPVIDLNFKQVVKAVSQVIDPKNRTFDIELKVPQMKQAVKPNMLAVLTINNYSNPRALTVPVNSLQKTGSDYFLFTARQNTNDESDHWVVERREVTPGEYQGDRIEINQGLKAGEHVVTFGYQDLADGQTVMLSSR
ncbi:MAG: efflux RND transporter periplasmic adaptor subunit [Calditrichota bacterium]